MAGLAPGAEFRERLLVRASVVLSRDEPIQVKGVSHRRTPHWCVSPLVIVGGGADNAHCGRLGYGLGYDEELLGAIADGGAGDALFAEDPDTAGRLISGEVEGLLSKAAQAARLTI